MTTLILVCLLEGESISFEVEVPAIRTVSYLKKAVQAEIPEFKDIAAHRLTLWRVEIPTTPSKITLFTSNDKPIPLSSLDNSEKAANTQYRLKEGDRLNENEVTEIRFLDPAMGISDEDAFGTGPLPQRKIYVIVQPRNESQALYCSMQAFKNIPPKFNQLRLD
ncbi:hypothetical protein BGZ65_007975 [Modicella reniformis]|uniref:Crinkler effector protein N-terminal domain-containing protein n=1 Tax=Modicella reniformis TaxID=1440133 RepID=A0A9P6IXV4_9FUNG|nr:hypothetical protein BGZ65_007975 [Modicella reniformis]